MPGIPGAILTAGLVGPVPLASGRVGFGGGVVPPPRDPSAYFAWSPATGALPLGGPGMEVEGTGGARGFSDTLMPSGFTPTGFVYAAWLFGGDATAANDEAIVHVTPSGAALVLREGDPEPGVPGRTVAFPSIFVPDDRSGEMLVATLSALYRVDGTGAFELLLDFAAPAPGFTEPFAGLGVGPLQSIERLGFSGRVQGEPAASDEGLWTFGDDGHLELRLREGDAVNADLFVRGLSDPRPVVDAAGRIAFLADTAGAALDARASILLHDPAGGLSLIAREGAPLPGFLDEHFAGPLSPPQMDAAGDVVFSGAIASAGGPPAQAIFAVRASGALEVVVRVGQGLEVRPGVWKTVSALAGPDLCFPATYFERLLSDDGRLVFRAWFEDETEGVFVAVPPEPRAGLLALAALGVAATARRGHAARGLASRSDEKGTSPS